MIALVLLLTLFTASGFLVADRIANRERSIVAEATSRAGQALSPIAGRAARQRYENIVVSALLLIAAFIVGYLVI